MSNQSNETKSEAVDAVTPEQKIRANVLFELGRRGFSVAPGNDQDLYVADAVYGLAEFPADVLRDAVRRALWTWRGVKVYPKIGLIRDRAIEILAERGEDISAIKGRKTVAAKAAAKVAAPKSDASRPVVNVGKANAEGVRYATMRMHQNPPKGTEGINPADVKFALQCCAVRMVMAGYEPDVTLPDWMLNHMRAGKDIRALAGGWWKSEQRKLEQEQEGEGHAA